MIYKLSAGSHSVSWCLGLRSGILAGSGEDPEGLIRGLTLYVVRNGGPKRRGDEPAWEASQANQD